MSKRLLTVLSICFVVAAGIALYVWADCCTGVPVLCDPLASKVGESDCDYQFDVHLDSQCVTTATVKLYYHETPGGGWNWHMMTTVEGPPYPDCVTKRVTLTLDDTKTYGYYFVSTGPSCSDRLPDGNAEYALDPDCD